MPTRTPKVVDAVPVEAVSHLNPERHAIPAVMKSNVENLESIRTRLNFSFRTDDLYRHAFRAHLQIGAGAGPSGVHRKGRAEVERSGRRRRVPPSGSVKT